MVDHSLAANSFYSQFEMTGSTEQYRPDSLAIFSNPVATDLAGIECQKAQLFKASTDSLHSFGITRATGHETSQSASGFAAQFDDLRPSAIIWYFGGDGGAHNFLEGMMMAKHARLGVISKGGNANDIAHGLHRRRDLNEPTRLLTHAAIRSLRPMHAELWPESSDRPLEVHAFGYFTIGFTACMAAHFDNLAIKQALNSINNRSLRLHKELMETVHQLPDAKLFDVIENGRRRTRADVTVSNGPRMAKGSRYREDIFSNTAQKVELGKPQKLRLALAAMRACFGATTTLYEPRSFDVISDSELMVQADGESFALPAGKTSVKISRSPRTIQVTTTRHNRRDYPFSDLRRKQQSSRFLSDFKQQQAA
jgi:diacylglycerol kinase family enzyme